ncbi:hypothetical protein Emed_003314 [Eimeria media]
MQDGCSNWQQQEEGCRGSKACGYVYSRRSVNHQQEEEQQQAEKGEPQQQQQQEQQQQGSVWDSWSFVEPSGEAAAWERQKKAGEKAEAEKCGKSDGGPRARPLPS